MPVPTPTPRKKVLDNMWRESSHFFDRPVEEKVTYIKPQVRRVLPWMLQLRLFRCAVLTPPSPLPTPRVPQDEYPFGYTKFKGEVLSAGKKAETLGKDGAAATAAAPDLKVRTPQRF